MCESKSVQKFCCVLRVTKIFYIRKPALYPFLLSEALFAANQLKTMRRHPGISPEGGRRCGCTRERPNSGPERCLPSAHLGPQTSLLIFGRTLSSKNSYFHISLGEDGTFVTWVPTFSFLGRYDHHHRLFLRMPSLTFKSFVLPEISS